MADLMFALDCVSCCLFIFWGLCCCYFPMNFVVLVNLACDYVGCFSAGVRREFDTIYRFYLHILFTTEPQDFI